MNFDKKIVVGMGPWKFASFFKCILLKEKYSMYFYLNYQLSYSNDL